MTHSDLVRIEVQGADILVAMRGTCFRVKYRKQEAPWLIAYEYGPDDPDATITLSTSLRVTLSLSSSASSDSQALSVEHGNRPIGSVL